MIRKIYEELKEEKNIRNNLIELRRELKIDSNRAAFLYCLEGDFSMLYELLKYNDAKVRKNVALILGELNLQESLDRLYEAYENEEQLFVKSSYLTAILNLDYRKYLNDFKLRYKEINENFEDNENRKHLLEESRKLNELIIMIEKPEPHTFTGYDNLLDIVLLTNRNYKNITASQIKKGKAKEFGAGVIVKSNDLRNILKIRTYSELLFMIKGFQLVEADIKKISEMVIKSDLISFLDGNHKEQQPFYFRIEIKGKMDLSQKSIFTKRLAGEIERLSERKLINSTSDYEIELRLIENKDSNYNMLVKLFTIKDKRFEYRKNVISSSISPVNGALVMELSRKYFIENAQVLDPFCGVGTMLIERNKIVKASPMYGLDIFGKAIIGARENAEADGSIINFINRDYFDFRHDYLFDEIVTNMPLKTGVDFKGNIEDLYNRFFEVSKKILRNNGIIVMYTKEADIVRNAVKKAADYKKIEEFEISRVERTYVFVVRYIREV